MALSLSPPDRNDQHHLSFLPHALPHHAWRTPPGAYAALPDLPHYARSNSGHSGSGSSSGSGSRSNPPSPKISKSAPASPSGRMGFYVSPMSTITPISLSGSQSPGVSTRDIGTRGELGRSTIPQLTPQQLAQLQAAQAIAIGHSYYPSGSALHTRPGDAPVQDQNNPQQIHSSAGPSRIRSQPVGVTAANYNSSNQLSPTSSPIAIPSPATRQSKSRSRSRHLRAESGSDTERGFDSDVTVMDRRRPGKASYSQTDLPALRSRLEGWRSGVSAPGGEAVADVGNTSRDSLGLLQIRNTDTITLPKPPGRRTPPATPSHRPVQLSNNPAPLPPPLAKQHSVPSGTFSSPRSRSSTSLASLRRSPNSSPRTIHAHLAPLTPVTPSLTFPPNVSPRIRTTDDGATSGDADEENDSQTDSQPDSELSFRTKSSGLRRRTGADVRSTALELSLGGTSSGGDKSDTTTTRTVGDIAPKPHAIERLYHASSLLSLRILAIVPSMWGTLVLSQALVSGGLWYDVWPWGADFSSEALYRLSQGGGDYEGDWRKVVRGDILLAVGWVSWRNSSHREGRIPPVVTSAYYEFSSTLHWLVMWTSTDFRLSSPVTSASASPPASPTAGDRTTTSSQCSSASCRFKHFAGQRHTCRYGTSVPRSHSSHGQSLASQPASPTQSSCGWHRMSSQQPMAIALRTLVRSRNTKSTKFEPDPSP